MPLTAFNWGYWGWGTHTSDLVRTVDAIERSRGKRSPVFADIRQFNCLSWNELAGLAHRLQMRIEAVVGRGFSQRARGCFGLMGPLNDRGMGNEVS
jgi:hypothetical protein